MHALLPRLRAATLAAFFCALAPALALAQSTLLQGGPWAPGHLPMYSGPSGFGQAVVQDSGPASGGGPGANPSEIGITARGMGTPPYASQGTGPFGTNQCDYDAPTTNPTGYHFICISANALGGGLLAYGAGGGAPVLPMTVNINGTSYAFPFTISGIIGPNTSVIGDIMVFNNTSGNLAADSGKGLPVGAVVGTTDPQTLAAKTLTSPVINTPIINSGTINTPVIVTPTITAPTISGASSLFGISTSAGTGTGNLVFSVSPTLTGVPLAPTAPANTNTQQIATTAFVQAALPSITSPANPDGRLTLSTGKPVMSSDVTAATTIYYDSYTGNGVPVYNGSAFQIMTIGSNEISMGLDAVTPHIAINNLYDVFGVNVSGALTLCAGPAWPSSTSRGSGAGSTQISLLSGIWTNTVALTHCWGGASGTTDLGTIGASQGIYLGTFYATANGQTSVQFKPTATAGGSAPIVGLFNAYNRVTVSSNERDSTASWTYSTATWRAADGSTGNRVTFVDGLAQSFYRSWFTISVQSSGGNTVSTGMNLNSVSAPPGTYAASNVSTGVQNTNLESWAPALGLNYVQAMEFVNSGTATLNVAPMNLMVQVDM